MARANRKKALTRWEQHQKRIIVNEYAVNDGNITAMAKHLGFSRNKALHLLDRFGIRRDGKDLQP